MTTGELKGSVWQRTRQDPEVSGQRKMLERISQSARAGLSYFAVGTILEGVPHVNNPSYKRHGIEGLIVMQNLSNMVEASALHRGDRIRDEDDMAYREAEWKALGATVRAVFREPTRGSRWELSVTTNQGSLTIREDPEDWRQAQLQVDGKKWQDAHPGQLAAMRGLFRGLREAPEDVHENALVGAAAA